MVIFGTLNFDLSSLFPSEELVRGRSLSRSSLELLVLIGGSLSLRQFQSLTDVIIEEVSESKVIAL